MNKISRRTFTQGTLGSLLTFSLLESLYSHDAFLDGIKPVTGKWIAELNDLAASVKQQKLTQVQWQNQVESLMKRVNLVELMEFVDFDKLTRNLKFAERGEKPIRYSFPQVEGLPTNLVFGHQIFAMEKGRAIAPHGHNNMATAFLVLKGQCHGRHYDRIEDEKDFLIIRPTIDKRFDVGGHSTISDHKDNIHWFEATSENAFIFNIHVLNIDTNIKRGGRVYVDPQGEKLANGLIKAKRLTHKQAYEKFG